MTRSLWKIEYRVEFNGFLSWYTDEQAAITAAQNYGEGAIVTRCQKQYLSVEDQVYPVPEE